MAWEWSHTAEAYQAVETNIRSQSREWLVVVYAEWRARKGNNFDERRYDRTLRFANAQTDEYLADAVVEWTAELRTCENGGWNAHCCPFGCGCHMVPFDAPNPETGAHDETA